jgi:hypothetical protein
VPSPRTRSPHTAYLASLIAAGVVIVWLSNHVLVPFESLPLRPRIPRIAMLRQESWIVRFPIRVPWEIIVTH